MASLEEQERELERRQSRLTPKKKSLAEQERELEAKQTRLTPRYKTRVDASLEVPTTFYSAPSPITRSVSTAKLPSTSLSQPSSTWKAKAMSYLQDIKQRPISVKGATLSVPISQGLQTWLAPIGIGQTGQITPRISHLVELTGIPYISREVQKVPWSELDDIVTNPKKTKEAAKLLGEYGLGIAGSLPSPFLALNQALEQQGIKSIVPTKSEQEIATLPFGDMIFVSAERKAELERFRKEGSYNPNTFWAQVQTAFRPVDLILTGTIAKGLVKIPTKSTQALTTAGLNKVEALKLQKLEDSILEKVVQSSLNKSVGNVVKKPLTEAEWKALGDTTFGKRINLRLTEIADELDKFDSDVVIPSKTKGIRASGQENLKGLEIVAENLKDFQQTLLPEDILRIKAGDYSLKTQKALEKKLKDAYDKKDYEAKQQVIKEAEDFLKTESKLPEARQYNKPQKEFMKGVVPNQVEEIVKKSDEVAGKKAQEDALDLRNRMNEEKAALKELKKTDKELKELERLGDEKRIARKKKQIEEDNLKYENKKKLTEEARQKAEELKKTDPELKKLQKLAKEKGNAPLPPPDKEYLKWREDINKEMRDVFGGKDSPSSSPPGSSKPVPPTKDAGDLGTETKFPVATKLKDKPVDAAKNIESPKDLSNALEKATANSVFYKTTNNAFAPQSLPTVVPNATVFRDILLANNDLKARDIKLWGNGLGEIGVSDNKSTTPLFEVTLVETGQKIKVEPITETSRASSPWVEISKPKDYIVNIPEAIKGKTTETKKKPGLRGGKVIEKPKTPSKKDVTIKIPDETDLPKIGKIVGTKIVLDLPKLTDKPKLGDPSKEKDKRRITIKEKSIVEDPEKIKEPFPEDESAKLKEGKKTEEEKAVKIDGSRKKGKPKKVKTSRKSLKNIKLEEPKEYGYLFTWQQGNQYPVANLLTNKVRYTRVRPRNLPMGNTVAETFTVLKSSKVKPQVRRLDIGKFFANISRGGVQFELKKKNLKKKYKY